MTEINYIDIVEIEDFPNYFVSTDGHVYSEMLGEMKKLKAGINSSGYYTVVLSKNKQVISKSVHRLVAETFLHNPDNKQFVDHINQIKTDNRLENLRFVTKSENNRNGSKRIDNTSGTLGVNYHKKKNNCWTAKWYDFDGKRKTKSFSTNKFGEDNAKELAIDFREEMEKLYYPTLTKCN